jgi:3-phosphoshikimate 1-carboxyvinyltransferase
MAEELPDGFIAAGNYGFQPLTTMIDHDGDHRIAMAFALMASRHDVKVTIPNPDVVNVSFPGFFVELEKIIGAHRIHFC